MVYCDTRLGGVKRWFAEPPSDLMRIPNSITSCVCFLCVKYEGGEHAGKYQSVGTGFFVGIDEGGYTFPYLVTARHVPDEIQRRGFTDLYVRLNKHDDSFDYLDVTSPNWTTYEDEAIDLAILPFAPPPSVFNFELLPMDMIATNEDIGDHGIGLGDDLFAVGLFTLRTGRQRNIPILRTGVIAAMPTEPLPSKRGGQYMAYLAEMRSIGGLSGSPVFTFINRHRPIHNLPEGKDWLYFLIGLIRGHWDLEQTTSDTEIADVPFYGKGESLNTGIAVVTPAQYIRGMLMSEPFTKERRKMIEKRDRENLPTEDIGLTKGIPPPLTKEGFEDALRRASGKTSEPESGKTQTSE